MMHGREGLLYPINVAVKAQQLLPFKEARDRIHTSFVRYRIHLASKEMTLGRISSAQETLHMSKSVLDAHALENGKDDVSRKEFLELRQQWWRVAKDYPWSLAQLFDMVKNGGETFTLDLSGRTEEAWMDYQAIFTIVKERFGNSTNRNIQLQQAYLRTKIQHKLGLLAERHEDFLVAELKLPEIEEHSIDLAKHYRKTAITYLTLGQPLAAMHAYEEELDYYRAQGNHVKANEIYEIYIGFLRKLIRQNDRDTYLDREDNPSHSLEGISDIVEGRNLWIQGKREDAIPLIKQGINTFLLYDLKKHAQLSLDVTTDIALLTHTLNEYANASDIEKQSILDKTQLYYLAKGLALLSIFNFTLMDKKNIHMQELELNVQIARLAVWCLDTLSSRETAAARKKNPYALGPEYRYFLEKEKYQKALEEMEEYKRASR